MSQLITIALLVAVETLSKEGSYSRAAEKLGMTPYFLKTQISALEEQLELRVFETHDDRVKISEEGQALIAACNALLRKSSL